MASPRRYLSGIVAGACAAPLLALAQPASGPQPAGPADSGKLTVEAQAARMAQARNQAASCAICHGPDGRPPAGSPIPQLAGRQQADLVEMMLDYKSGKRPGTVMPQIARGYSDAEIIAMAAWFADQK
ncbi:c-type cytochrome [Cupriavidus sp. BIS7]|uniref:c-type cytochrome n=1 Tax=Cupriavidus sp. BIS7 TaxID=1217718 RepID=UPI0002DD74BC|nr:c-type cytochrome [Cupriavidus sp. BIS7]